MLAGYALASAMLLHSGVVPAMCPPGKSARPDVRAEMVDEFDRSDLGRAAGYIWSIRGAVDELNAEAGELFSRGVLLDQDFARLSECDVKLRRMGALLAAKRDEFRRLVERVGARRRELSAIRR